MAATRPRPSIREALSAACALAGVAGAGGVAHAQDTQYDTAALIYSEPQRVTAVESVFMARHDFGGDRLGDFKIVFDALTGASANGAVPSASIQTFTRPSGQGAYTVAPGETPLDTTFKDTRFAVSGGLGFPLSRLTKATTGLHLSGERDYTSFGIDGTVSRDFDQRNTTLSAGASLSLDTVRPMGGAPDPLTEMVAPSPIHGGEGEDDGGGGGPGESKHVVDGKVGMTQILNRTTLVQFNYTLSRVTGYQTDPYKLVSLVDPTTGSPISQLYEKRPDSRNKHILYGELKHQFTHDILDVSYRWMSDDWGVRSRTADMHYRWAVGGDKYLQPHVRWYKQTAADFYTGYLLSGAPLPDFASADYRLGAFRAWTVGMEHGRTLENGHRLSLRLEYYWQTGTADFSGAPGYLGGANLFPVVDAWIVHVGYSFDS